MLTTACAPASSGQVVSANALCTLQGPLGPRGRCTHGALLPADAWGVTAEPPLLIKGAPSHLGDMSPDVSWLSAHPWGGTPGLEEREEGALSGQS